MRKKGGETQVARPSVLLCSYSFGLGNGIAHVDSALLAGIDKKRFSLKAVVVRPDFAAGQREVLEGKTHISLCDAFAVLYRELRETDILHVNGALDPVGCNAAVAAGVPRIIEVMHQVEAGGLHPAIDTVVCVSGLVRTAQTRPDAVVIPNGIDTEWFSFKPGRRDAETVSVVQVANAAKKLHCELGDVAGQLDAPNVRAFTAGDRPAVGNLPSMGAVADMPGVYHGADLLFLIERRSAFGLVFAEAMACGTLPVVSADSGAVEFVTHRETGWIVNPANPGEAAKVLREAVATVGTPRFLTMQRQARAVVEQKFSTRHMVKGYETLYAATADLPRRRPGKPAAWMHLAAFAQLFFQKNSEAVFALQAFLDDQRPLEAYFFAHPAGAAVIRYLVETVCPALLRSGRARLVLQICARLRFSRLKAPELDMIEDAARKWARDA